MYFICTSYILIYEVHFKKCTLSILLQTSVLVKKFSQRKVHFTISILKKLKTQPENIICWYRFKTKV